MLGRSLSRVLKTSTKVWLGIIDWFRTFWYTSMSSRVMLFPDGEGARPLEDGDGDCLGLFLLPNSLLGSLAMSLLPLLPLACLLKLSIYKACTAVRVDHLHSL